MIDSSGKKYMACSLRIRYSVSTLVLCLVLSMPKNSRQDTRNGFWMTVSEMNEVVVETMSPFHSERSRGSSLEIVVQPTQDTRMALAKSQVPPPLPSCPRRCCVAIADTNRWMHAIGVVHNVFVMF